MRRQTGITKRTAMYLEVPEPPTGLGAGQGMAAGKETGAGVKSFPEKHIPVWNQPGETSLAIPITTEERVEKREQKEKETNGGNRKRGIHMFLRETI